MLIVFSILVFVAFIQAIHSTLPANQYVELVSDITARFHAGCVFLVHPSSLGIPETSKLLAKKGVHVSLLDPKELNKTSNSFTCKRNRPLYVLNSNEATRAHVKLMRKMASNPRWVVFLDESQTIDDFFLGVHVPFNCEVLVARNLDPGIQLTEVYQVAENFPLRKRNFGTWTPDTGLTATTLSLYRRRNDLEGLVLRATSLDLIPLEVARPENFVDFNLGEEIYHLVWNYLQYRLNFTTIKEHGVLGENYLAQNGPFDYMLNMVTDKIVDVAIDGFTLAKERMGDIEFLSPIKISRIDLIVRKPITVHFQWTSFLAPFVSSLWLGMVGTLTLSGSLLTLSYQVGRRQGLEEHRGENEFNLINSLFHVLGLYCSQGSPFEPRSVSSRTVLLLAGLTSTVVVAAYSGALTSFISVQKLDLPYETIQEYVDDKAYQIEMTANTFWLHVNNSHNAMFRGLYTRIVDRLHELPGSRWGGVKKLCSSRKPFGWVGTFSFDANFLSELSCEIISVPGYVAIGSESIIIIKGCPYKQLFNHNLAAMRGTGVLKHMFLLASPPPLVNADSSVPNLELYQVVPILCVLLAGVALSLLLILAELAQSRWTLRSVPREGN